MEVESSLMRKNLFFFRNSRGWENFTPTKKLGASNCVLKNCGNNNREKLFSAHVCQCRFYRARNSPDGENKGEQEEVERWKRKFPFEKYFFFCWFLFTSKCFWIICYGYGAKQRCDKALIRSLTSLLICFPVGYKSTADKTYLLSVNPRGAVHINRGLCKTIRFIIPVFDYKS